MVSKARSSRRQSFPMVSMVRPSRRQRFLIISRAVITAVIPVLIQGVFFALEGPWEAFNVIAMCLAVAYIFLSWKYLRTVNDLLALPLIFLFITQLCIFIITLFGTEPPYHFRLLQVAIVVSYISTAITLLLARARILALRNAFLLVFSVAIVFFVVEIILELAQPSIDNNQTTFVGPEWIGRMESHPDLGVHYAPYSILKTCYPDNPRGYFEEVDTKESKWRLFVNNNDNEASLVSSPYNPEKMRIDIRKAKKVNPWEISLFMQQLSLKYFKDYTLTFKARADRPRNISVSCNLTYKPWHNMGLYKNIELTSEWKSFNEKFIAKATDDKASIQFDFGNSDISVELSDITFRNMSDNELVEPELSFLKRFQVSYKFNALGCRGRDYTISSSSDAIRIVLLGNSFTLGVGVHEEDTFANQLERLLNKQAKLSGSVETYEVINCGVSGYSTRENRLFYEMLASKYEPDIVLLVMAGENDLTFIDEISTPDSPGKFESLFYIWSRMRKDRHDSLPEILQLYDETQKHDARLAVVLFRNVSDSPASVKSSLYKNWINFINRISNGLKDKEIPLLDLGYALFENHSEEDLFVHKVIDGHPNELAHNITARELKKFLDKEGWIKNNDKHLSLKDFDERVENLFNKNNISKKMH